MAEDAASSARTRKDSSIVQCAEVVRDGRADAMVGAGNTGATMAAALLRMGRIQRCRRVPRSRCRSRCRAAGPSCSSTAARLSTARPIGWCSSPAWAASTRGIRFGVDAPTVGSPVERRGAGQGRRPAQGDVQAARRRSRVSSATSKAAISWCRQPDVVVTDGFTGNVDAEEHRGRVQGDRRARVRRARFDAGSERSGQGHHAVAPDAAADLDPDSTGGAVLLGLDGVCVISHGSSSATRDRQRHARGSGMLSAPTSSPARRRHLPDAG